MSRVYRTMPLRRAIPVGCALFMGVSILMRAGAASAAEIIPSVGLTRSVDSDNVKSSVGLGLRGSLIPGVGFLKGEIGAQYAQQELYNGDLKLKQWPITASVWFAPVPSLYAGVGAGWYHTTFDYAASTGLDNRTEQDFGVHVGGGLRVPVVPHAALDLQGRYVFLEDQESKLVPEKFNPDFWTLSLGLAIGF
jgi:Outer membrane protein beta-barrel domain